jgi:hypothetical protein
LHLWIDGSSWFLPLLFRGLRDNQHLQALRFHRYSAKRRLHVDGAISEDIVGALGRRSAAVARVEGLHVRRAGHWSRVEWLLALNRYGRRLLDRAEGPDAALPPGLWPHALYPAGRDGRVDVMYHFFNRLARRSVVPDAVDARWDAR